MSVRFRLADPRQLVALGFGAGLLPRAPGTAGSAAALPLILVLSPLPVPLYIGVTAMAFLFGCWVCGATARAVKVHDHPAIVWDEVVGMLITCTALAPTAVNLIAAFVLFRVFDILKPWPIRVLDRRVTGGIGIMADDALAGVAALVLLQSGMLLLRVN